ncbi:MAG: hypothetical protein M3173_00610 [Chloroflexota bacterium]|nr:hypothetical protein [Chloroflexota bacterium]
MSLHPIDDAVVSRFMATVTGDAPPQATWQPWWPDRIPVLLERMRAGDERAANEVTLRLAYALGTEHPTFAAPGFGLTFWEARIDRGVGMYLRPPSRLFREFGLELEVLRTMPIRVDTNLGLMGGAFIPAHLVPKVKELLETREQRMARRLREAEYDPVVALTLFNEALDYALEHGMGLYEALDAVGPGGESVFDGVVVIGSRDRVPKAERKRIEELSKPPKKPGLIQRMLGRGGPESANGRLPGE